MLKWLNYVAMVTNEPYMRKLNITEKQQMTVERNYSIRATVCTFYFLLLQNSSVMNILTF